MCFFPCACVCAGWTGRGVGCEGARCALLLRCVRGARVACAQAPPAAAGPAVRVASMTTAELRNECKKQGLAAGGQVSLQHGLPASTRAAAASGSGRLQSTLQHTTHTRTARTWTQPSHCHARPRPQHHTHLHHTLHPRALAEEGPARAPAEDAAAGRRQQRQGRGPARVRSWQLMRACIDGASSANRQHAAGAARQELAAVLSARAEGRVLSLCCPCEANGAAWGGAAAAAAQGWLRAGACAGVCAAAAAQCCNALHQALRVWHGRCTPVCACCLGLP